MVQAAIASALTKFDDLEASFATHGHVGTASILTAEVLRDELVPSGMPAMATVVHQATRSVLPSP